MIKYYIVTCSKNKTIGYYFTIYEDCKNFLQKYSGYTIAKTLKSKKEVINYFTNNNIKEIIEGNANTCPKFNILNEKTKYYAVTSNINKTIGYYFTIYEDCKNFLQKYSGHTIAKTLKSEEELMLFFDNKNIKKIVKGNANTCPI